MSMTRRTVLAAAPAAALGGPALAQQPASAQTAAPSQQAPSFYRYKVGDIEVTAIHDGFAPRPLDGLVRNADLSDVKEAMADAFLPTDVLPITFTTLALKTGGRLVLIDTGNGDSGAPTTGRWMANFKAAGFDPAQVNTIIISHFHPDHINGLRLKDGTAVFPNAEVMVAAPEWAFWMDNGKMAQAPDALKGNFQNVRRVFGPMAKDVKLYEADKELAPGITHAASTTHTRYLMNRPYDGRRAYRPAECGKPARIRRPRGARDRRMGCANRRASVDAVLAGWPGVQVRFQHAAGRKREPLSLP